MHTCKDDFAGLREARGGDTLHYCTDRSTPAAVQAHLVEQCLASLASVCLKADCLNSRAHRPSMAVMTRDGGVARLYGCAAIQSIYPLPPCPGQRSQAHRRRLELPDLGSRACYLAPSRGHLSLTHSALREYEGTVESTRGQAITSGPLRNSSAPGLPRFKESFCLFVFFSLSYFVCLQLLEMGLRPIGTGSALS